MLLPQTLQFRVPIQMENAIWFLILAVLSLFLIAYTFFRQKKPEVIALVFGAERNSALFRKCDFARSS
ncbi:hypothetical protein J2T14_000933 [Paenibacillus harenae]|nr:hypothetical protein [Paenibacillus harenae]